ncbi:MAG: hypothetical protein H0W14_01065 [Actinobacteria bacterium]|nr:hypothetical protein [Actinomycetota bacterium]
MTKATKRSAAKPRTPQHPQRRPQQREVSRGLLYAIGAAGLAGILAVVIIVSRGESSATTAAAGLPQTSDYHSLLVSSTDASRLVLGTHQGLFESLDGGLNWQQAELVGQDAMNLARAEGQTLWAAGHNVLARSGDGGASWQNVSPAGLPGLDVHGFAVDPSGPRTLYAAVAGKGLYRSRDGGESFALASAEVGGGVMALAVTPDGRLLAGDMERQALLVSKDGGRSWEESSGGAVAGLAVNPSDPKRIAASGAGVLLSTDGGRSWRETLVLPDGSGPIAWAKSSPLVGYVVGFDRSLHKTSDGGETWAAVVSPTVN